ncbi:MAG: phosphatase PAP2 family protein [Actinomycetota bacterium]
MKGNPRSRKLTPTSWARLGIIGRQPLLWAAISAGMAAFGGDRGRRASLRGTLCYLAGAAVGNLPKPLFSRPQPRHRWVRKPQVARGSFPSGHAAAEVAYVFGASMEQPVAFLPLSVVAMAGHASLVKAGKHYLSDTIVGGSLGIGVAAVAAKLWPPNGKALRV